MNSSNWKSVHCNGLIFSSVICDLLFSRFSRGVERGSPSPGTLEAMPTRLQLYSNRTHANTHPTHTHSKRDTNKTLRTSTGNYWTCVEGRGAGRGGSGVTTGHV